MAAGMVSYGKNSDRQQITKVQREPSSNACAVLWIRRTEIHPRGDAYKFHLERLTLADTPVTGCRNVTDTFVDTDRSYVYAPGDSVSIRDLPAAGTAAVPPSTRSGGPANNPLDAIVPDVLDNGPNRPAVERHDATSKYNRTTWVYAPRSIIGNRVALRLDPRGGERVVTLRSTEAIARGHVGQIEAVRDRRALVRFYAGTPNGPSALSRLFRRWAENTGGPYVEKEDEFFSRKRAVVLEVSLEDVLELNDYLDRSHIEQTGAALEKARARERMTGR
jgi:hypothetical protein